MMRDLESWEVLDALTGEHGEALFVIDGAGADAALDAMRRAFGDMGRPVRYAYSYKTNPTPAICRWALSRGLGAEVASGLELWLARRVGVPDADIILTGVGRGSDTVADALSAGSLVVLDGDRDVDSALEWASAADDRTVGRLLLRVRVPTPRAPEPRLGMTAAAAIDAHRHLASMPSLEVVGLHAHVVEKTLHGLTARLDAFEEIGSSLFPEGPPILDLGSPLPVTSRADAEETWRPYAHAVSTTLARLGWVRTTVVMEPGASLVAGSVSLVARVLDVRQQPGRTVATVAASILHSSPNMRRVDFPVRLVAQPLLEHPPQSDPVFIAGSTLIDGDWLAVDLHGTVLPGDFVVIDGVGAYSIGMDSSFIDPPLPVAMHDGETWSTARRAPSFEEVMVGFDL